MKRCAPHINETVYQRLASPSRILAAAQSMTHTLGQYTTLKRLQSYIDKTVYQRLRIAPLIAAAAGSISLSLAVYANTTEKKPSPCLNDTTTEVSE